MSKQWINTRVEYQWSDELGELVQLSKEGYWYEGEMTLCSDVTINYTQFKHDTNTHTGYVGSGTHLGGGGGTTDLTIRSSNSLHLTTSASAGPGIIIDANRNVMVGGGANGSLPAAYNHSAGRGNLAVEGTTNSVIAWGVNGTRKGYAHHSGTDLRITNTHAGSLFLGTTETDRITILAAGNVGIGTTAPQSLLHLFEVNSTPTVAGSFSDSQIGFHNNTTIGDYSQMTFGYPIGNTYGAAYIGFVSTSIAGIGKGDLVLGTRSGTTDVQATERMRIDSSGNVGIGDTSPSYKLEVAGTFYSSGSSIEYKEDVEPYTPPEGALMSLKPVQYQYKDAWKDFGKRYSGNSSKQLGFVAEDVAKILPELAVTKTEDGQEVVRNVDYEKLTVLLVSEVQKLRTELNELKSTPQ